LRPKPNVSIKGHIVNPFIEGVGLHWSPSLERNLACPGEGCKEDHVKRPPRWYGYLAIMDRGLGKIVLAEITYQAAKDNPLLDKGQDSLRGLVLTLKRYGNAKRGRVRAEIEPFHRDLGLPPAIDVRKALVHIFGFEPPAMELPQTEGVNHV
jgi:hypothetical protein